MKRYDLSRKYRHGVGMPEIIEQADGRFVRWEDALMLREALRKCAAILSGVDLNKNALVSALEQTCAALTAQEQER